MYKLIGHGLTRGEKIVPESQPMTLQERDSQSTIVLDPETMPEIGFDDWILDDGWPEGDHVWRVRNFGDNPLEDNVSIELEHVIKTLDDRQIVDDITTKMISGGSTCTARQAVEYLLAMQSDWTLGDFDYESVSNPYEFTGGSILDGIEAVTATLENSQWEYDMSVYPFVLHIRQRDTEAACEMRCGRNLATLRRTISRGGMFTRIYPTGQNNLHLTEGYLSKNENLYGRIEREETDQNKTNEGSLRAWAQGMLNRHCEPEMNISISGLELSEETGEALDRLRMNRVCRVPLPKKNIMILERIVRLQWRDRLREPENVGVTLANNNADITEIVKSNKRSGGRAAKGQAKQNYLFQANGDNLLYEVFDECGHVHGALRMTEESLRIGFENLNESTRSEFRLTSESLRIQFENEISSTRSEFRMTSESLRIQFANEISSTRSEFQATSESLRVSFVNETASLRTDIQAEAGRISLVVEGSGSGATVKRASIIAAVTDNNGQLDSSITMAADNVIIGSGDSSRSVTVVVNGKLTTSDLSSSIANLGLVEVQRLSTTNDIAAGSLYGQNIYISGATAQADPFSVKNFVKNVRVTTATSGYKLQYQTYSGGDTWTDAGNFSSAVTLSGAWSSGRYTVSATSGTITGTAPSTALIKGTETWENGVASVPIMYYDTDSTRPEGNAYTASVNAPAATVSAGTWTNGAVTVTAKHGTATLGSATVNAPTVTVSAGTWSNGSVTVNAKHGTATLGTNVISAPSATVSAGTWANGAVTVTAKHGTATLGSATVNAPTVTVSAGSWSNGSITINATHGTKNLGTTVVNAPSATVSAGSWSNGSVTVTAKHGTATLGSTTVSAPSASLSFDCTDLGSSTEGNSKPITATAKHGTATLGTGSQVIYMGTGSWSSGKIGVTCRLTDSNGKCVCRVYVSKPSVSITRAVKTGNTYTVYGKVGGSSEIQLGTHSA